MIRFFPTEDEYFLDFFYCILVEQEQLRLSEMKRNSLYI